MQEWAAIPEKKKPTQTKKLPNKQKQKTPTSLTISSGKNKQMTMRWFALDAECLKAQHSFI